MLYSGTDLESYATENTLVYEEQILLGYVTVRGQSLPGPLNLLNHIWFSRSFLPRNTKPQPPKHENDALAEGPCTLNPKC